ncbi:transcription factor RSL2-like [Triticum dicoccoides]|uniref:transcription factor RSL2-like n=1 Tax=Triticum dicoccoides TaxID=85692 RepID=UPI00188ED2DF|nr:transcription factor RSL2-like [Triticum dicoccoides]
MESSEASWHSFDPSVVAEDSEEMARLLGVQFFGNEQKQHPAAAPPSSMYWPGQEAADQYYTPAPYCMQMQEHASAGAGYYSHGYYDGDATAMAGNFFVAPEEQIMADPAGFMVDLNLQFDDQDDGAGTSAAACKRKFGDQNGTQSDTVAVPKKKARSTVPPVQRKGKSSAQPKKASKGSCSRGGQEESNGEANNNVQSSSNYLSDEEGSLEMTSCSNMSSASKKTSSSRGDHGHGGGAKARAGRGAATDPQSLYARKRREKINERLKVLQNLIPNGTKVDISTMLEEAVHYIKFMQLQIKLLSSDDMWMFAPIAYNGFNVGLDLKIAPPQQ